MEFARTSPKNLKLILTARRIDALKHLAEEIKGEVGAGVRVLVLKLDVSNPEEVRGFVGSLPSDFKDVGRSFRILYGCFHEILLNHAMLRRVSQASSRGLDPLPHTEVDAY